MKYPAAKKASPKDKEKMSPKDRFMLMISAKKPAAKKAAPKKKK